MSYFKRGPRQGQKGEVHVDKFRTFLRATYDLSVFTSNGRPEAKTDKNKEVLEKQPSAS